MNNPEEPSLKIPHGSHPSTPRHGRGMDGFTLIELMIVVVVIAILAAIAIPSYTQYVLRSHRAQAKADLVEYAQAAERHFTVNNTYAGFPMAAQSPRQGGGVARYTLAANTTASTFTITATPVGAQSRDRCGNLGINQAGVKTRGNASEPFGNCW